MTVKTDTAPTDRHAPRPARPLARAPGRGARAGHRPPVPRQADLPGALRAGGRRFRRDHRAAEGAARPARRAASASASPRSPRATSRRTAPASTSSGCATAPPSRRSTSRTRDRRTFCISSQAGCALACSFCVTGYWGAGRNLTAGEIVGQVLAIRADRDLPMEGLNLVFMGMGEPLLNLENVKAALDILDRVDLAAPHHRLDGGHPPRPGGDGPLGAPAEPGDLAARAGRGAPRPDHADQPHLSAGRADARAARASRWRKGRKLTFEYILIRGLQRRPPRRRPARPGCSPACAPRST